MQGLRTGTTVPAVPDSAAGSAVVPESIPDGPTCRSGYFLMKQSL